MSRTSVAALLVAVLWAGVAWGVDTENLPSKGGSMGVGTSSGSGAVVFAYKSCNGLPASECFDDSGGTAIDDAVEHALDSHCSSDLDLPTMVEVGPGRYTAGFAVPSAADTCSTPSLLVYCRGSFPKVVVGSDGEDKGSNCEIILSDDGVDDTGISVTKAGTGLSVMGIHISIDDADANGDSETGVSITGNNVRFSFASGGGSFDLKNSSKGFFISPGGTLSRFYIHDNQFTAPKAASSTTSASLFHIEDLGTSLCATEVLISDNNIRAATNGNDSTMGMFQFGVAGVGADNGCVTLDSPVVIMGNRFFQDEDDLHSLLRFYADSGDFMVHLQGNVFNAYQAADGTDLKFYHTEGTGTAAHEVLFEGNVGIDDWNGTASTYDTEHIVTGRIDLRGDVNDTVRFCGVAPTGGTTNFLGPDNHDGSGSVFGAASCDARDNTNETTAKVVLYQQAARPHSMACQLSSATSTDTLTFQLRDDEADYVGVTCDMGTGVTTCDVSNGRLTEIAAGSAFAIEVSQSGTEAITADALCLVETAVNP